VELAWLEDYLSLATVHSFTRAAEERNITQSTLSRRIKNLENWLGAELVDRSCYPIELTKVGEQFSLDCKAILMRIYQARADVRRNLAGAEASLVFTVQHAIARYVFPQWLGFIEERLGPLSVHLKSDDLADCVEDLLSGFADLVMCFHRPDIRPLFEPSQFMSTRIAVDRAIPISAPDAEGRPLFELPGSRDKPLPYIRMGSSVPLGHQTESILSQRGLTPWLSVVRDVSVSDVIVEMVKSGQGIGWVPHCVAAPFLQTGDLVLAGGSDWEFGLDILLLRKQTGNSIISDAVWEQAVKTQILRNYANAE